MALKCINHLKTLGSVEIFILAIEVRRQNGGKQRRFVWFYQTVQITSCNALENQINTPLYGALYKDAYRKFSLSADFFVAEYAQPHLIFGQTPAARLNHTLYQLITLAY